MRPVSNDGTGEPIDSTPFLGVLFLRQQLTAARAPKNNDRALHLSSKSALAFRFLQCLCVLLKATGDGNWRESVLSRLVFITPGSWMMSTPIYGDTEYL